MATTSRIAAAANAFLAAFCSALVGVLENTVCVVVGTVSATGTETGGAGVRILVAVTVVKGGLTNVAATSTGTALATLF